MTVTLTSRLGLSQWGAGSDAPGRSQFNTIFAKIDGVVAIDDGAAAGAALPTAGVNGQPLSDGRYASTLTGAYRKFYRRSGGAWAQVGGNTWDQTTYLRADGALATGAAARTVSHPNLTNPGRVENWDGTSVVGGRQSIADVNSGAPGALHVGDSTTAVDLTVRGRMWALTAGTAGRGFVATAGTSDAGNLFTVRDFSGNEPWSVDATGRMRSQAAVAFGGAGLTANVPLVSAPGANDLTAADLYAATGKPAVRVFRAVNDSVPIGLFEQDKITLGRPSWTGGLVDLQGPGARVAGQLEVLGLAKLSASATVAGTLVVAGATTLATLTATTTSVTSLASAGPVSGSALTLIDGLSAHGALVTTAVNGSGAEVRTRPVAQNSGTTQQSVRAPMVYRHRQEMNQPMTSGTPFYWETTVQMPEDGYMHMEAEILFLADTGNSNSYELWRGYVDFSVRQTATGSALVSGPAQGPGSVSNQRMFTIPTDDSTRQIGGYRDESYTEVFGTRLTAGAYKIRANFSSDTPLGGRVVRTRYTITSIVLHSVGSS